ncbi:hypothetical protein EDC96DRAFT_493369 [Choanephora cucurbitarum]|nr:hypothetical protein EDC96DRAFT_493369 [Choanephora cucurbitarum]
MTISIRIAHLDHYMAKPGPLDRSYSPFCKKRLNKVPIVRIFGSTRAGQKVCLHVHQVRKTDTIIFFSFNSSKK